MTDIEQLAKAQTMKPDSTVTQERWQVLRSLVCGQHPFWHDEQGWRDLDARIASTGDDTGGLRALLREARDTFDEYANSHATKALEATGPERASRRAKAAANHRWVERIDAHLATPSPDASNADDVVGELVRRLRVRAEALPLERADEANEHRSDPIEATAFQDDPDVRLLLEAAEALSHRSPVADEVNSRVLDKGGEE